MPAVLEFWFEFASTYSYPAAMRIEALCAAAGVALRWRPFLLGPIFAAQGWRDSPFNIYPVKGDYMWRDLARLCDGYGLPLRRPSAFPRNGLLAARVVTAHAAAPWVPRFVRAVYQANFVDDFEIAEPAVLGDVLAELGLAPAPILAAAGEEAAKQGLRAQTDEAIRRGIFGAPACTVGGELFWGNDRLDEALAWASGAPAADEAAVDEVLHFWFGAPDDDAATLAAKEARWFAADASFDRECTARFAALVSRAVRGELDAWQRTPRGRLALIVLLDQLPRNIYRGRAAAFTGDARALRLALAGIDAGADRALEPVERSFFYLPLEHAEDAAVQQRSVEAFAALAASVGPTDQALAVEWLAFARQHRDLIARFGRFPHRNRSLGRPSTPAEQAYLESAPTFGQ